MSKKILGICAALVALAALAIPASASAAATLAETPGSNYETLKVGALITATNDGNAIFEAGGGTVVCDHNWMTADVHTNDDTNGITGTITAAKFQGPEAETKCSSSLLGPTKVDIPALTNEGGTGHWCIKNKAGTDNFEVLGRGCTDSTNGPLTFTLTGSITCTYTRSAGVSGHFTTTKEDPKAATLKVTGEPEFTKEAPSAFLCPASGKITQMAFYLYTENPEETPVYIEDA